MDSLSRYYIGITQEHQTKKMQGRTLEEKQKVRIITPYHTEMKKGQCRFQHYPFKFKEFL